MRIQRVRAAFPGAALVISVLSLFIALGMSATPPP
jgi:hypothetical protein